MRVDDVCVIGAGPYGLTATAHLRAAGVNARILGDVMSFWRTMPDGMLLRSSRNAISLSDPARALSLDDFERERASPLPSPVARADFVRYGEWFQRRSLPDVDPRPVEHVAPIDGGFRVLLSDGDILLARRVVVATGLANFARRLPVFDRLQPDQVTHSLHLRDCSIHRGKQVLVIGSGQSALEAAVLLTEAGARVELVTRAPRIYWLAQTHDTNGGWGPLELLLYPPGAIGPPGINLCVKLPRLYRALPGPVRIRGFTRAVRPAGSDWIRPRFAGVTETLGRSVTTAETIGDRIRVGLDDGSDRLVNHVVQGTGFEIDVSRFGVLSPEIVRSLRTLGGQPRLGPRFESSVAGLHFLGAASDLSYGPLMRAIAGTGFAAKSLTRQVVAGLSRAGDPQWRKTTLAVEPGLDFVPALPGNRS
jgi:hypothetical protein